MPTTPALWPPKVNDFSLSAVILHKRLCSSPLPNAFSARIAVPTILNIDFWKAALISYHDHEIVTFLEFGWPINYTASQWPHPVNHNHPSAVKHAPAVQNVINKEVNLKATAGPFSENPFDCPIMLSPLLTVPKKNSLDRRLVLDLSFPPEHSVNDGIPTDSLLGEPFQPRLPGVDALVHLVQQLGPGCFLFKTDLSRAYRQLPIDPRDYHFLGYSFDDLIFFDTVFAFGLRPATLGCQRTINAITYLFWLLGYFCINYIDDFGGCDSPSRAAEAFHALKKLIFMLGLQTSPEKDCPPSTSMVFLGILFDTISMTLLISQEKLNELLDIIESVVSAKNISRRRLQSLLGLMSFVTACIRPGRIFMSALLNGLRSLPRQGRLTISDEIRSDLQWWIKFLHRFNGISIIPSPVYCPDVIITDACLTGAGGHFQDQYFHIDFPEHIMQDDEFNINVKELLAIIVALRLWGPQLAGSRLLLKSDNCAAVQAINNRCSRAPLMQQCLRVLWLLCATSDLDVQAEHIPGYVNILADLLSRWSHDPQAESKFYRLYDANNFVFRQCPDNVFDLSLDVCTIDL